MCTVSWVHGRDGYDVFCNRDERLTRSRARLPRIRATLGVRHIAPADPEGGGTWIGVNEYGVTVCLVNGYPGSTAPVNPVSRGRLVSSLLASRSSLEAISQTGRRDLSRFAPFTLVALDAGAPPRALAWDGKYTLALPDANELRPLTSSSLDQKTAAAVRRCEWRQCLRRHRRVNASMLHDYHRSHAPHSGPWSVCMHRDGAETVSFTHVSVSAARVRMHYSPEPPCRAGFIVTTSIDRRPLRDFIPGSSCSFHLAG